MLNHRLFCRSCLLTGAGLLLIGSVVAAQDFGISPGAQGAVSWEAIGTLALGVLVSMVGAYAKGLDSRTTRNEADIAELRNTVLGGHLDKHEVQSAIQSALAPLRVELSQNTRSTDAIHRRLDAVGFPARTTGPQPAMPGGGA